MNVWQLLLVATVGMSPVVVFAQAGAPSFPDEARKRLDYAIGKWRSEAEFLDERGRVTRTEVSETDRRFVLDDRVVAIAGVMLETGRSFRAWEYYDTRERKYTLTAINRDGTLFTMKGDLGERFVWESEGRENPDGTTTAIRFEHIDLTDSTFTAVGERTRDGGKTWRQFSRQFLKRIGD